MVELMSSSRKMFADGIAYNEGLTDYANKYKQTLQRDVLQEIRQEINDEFLRCDANAWSDVAKGLLSARCIIDKKIKELSE